MSNKTLASPGVMGSAETAGGFDEKFFANLLRDLGNDSISVKTAVGRAHKKIRVEN